MINDITSLNSKPVAETTIGTKSPQNKGILAKLSSEIRLINNLPQAQVTNTKNLGTSQLAQLTTPDQKSYSVISDNAANGSPLRPGERVSLQREPDNTVTLIRRETPSNVTTNSSRGYPAQNSRDTYASAAQSSSPSSANSTANATVTQIRGQLTSGIIAIQSQGTSQPTGSTGQFTTNVTIQDQTTQLITQHPINPNEKLLAVVDQQGKLQFIPPDKAPTTGAQQGLSQTLPTQLTKTEMTQTLQQLQQLANIPEGKLAPQLQAAIKTLIQTLPNIQSIQSEQGAVRQAMQTSGIFAESNLGKSEHLDKDLKVNLGRIDQAVKQVQAADSKQPLPPTLERISGAIDRITTQQLTQLVDKETNQTFPIQMELPIRHGESTSSIGVKIDHDRTEQPTPEPHKRRWLVQLKFEFEETGKFESRVSIKENQVRVLFAVEQPETEQLIRDNLTNLKQDLRRRNIRIDGMDCFLTKLTEEQDMPKLGETRLIDVRT